MQPTKIPWATHSWNPTSGCGGPKGVPCSYCYARKSAHRFGRSFEPTPHPEKLREPLAVEKPARIFVDSNGDLFDPAIPASFIEQVFGTMLLAHWHTFIILTKQAERARDWYAEVYQARTDLAKAVPETTREHVAEEAANCAYELLRDNGPTAVWERLWDKEGNLSNDSKWPLPNVWLGVTAEHQAAADERIPLLLQTPAAVRFVSIEPLLGAVDLRTYLYSQFYGGDPVPYRAGTILPPGYPDTYIPVRLGPCVNWVICGEDSTPGAKMPDPAWVQSIIEQCKAACVPLFVKGAIAVALPIQEYPEVSR